MAPGSLLMAPGSLLMAPGSLLIASVSLLLSPVAFAQNWPQAAGPSIDFQAEGEAPTKWSVVRDENVAWRTPLPEAGQSAVTVWGDKVFTTIHKPIKTFEERFVGGEIIGYCLDAKTGKVLWTVELPGTRRWNWLAVLATRPCSRRSRTTNTFGFSIVVVRWDASRTMVPKFGCENTNCDFATAPECANPCCSTARF